MRRLRFLAVMLLSLFLWQSTEIRAAATEASATVNGKTVNYSYEFTESGGDVTFSITITSIKDGNGFSLFDSFTRTEQTYTQAGQSVAYYRYILTDATTVSGYSVVFA